MSGKESFRQALRRYGGAALRLAGCRVWNGILDGIQGSQGSRSSDAELRSIASVRHRRYPRADDIVLARGLHGQRREFSEVIDAYQRQPREIPASPRVVFLLNVLHRTGGVISVVQLANDLEELGWETRVVLRSNHGYCPDLGLKTAPQFFRDDKDLVRSFPDADLVIGTLWPTMYLVAEIFQQRRNFTPAYFVQDFEPRFHDAQPVLATQARDSYHLTPCCFAKTEWICDQVSHCGGKIELVPPALDLERFVPRSMPRAEKKMVLAMLRPSTPRRGFHATIEVLDRLARSRNDIEIHAFGVDDEELLRYAVPFPLVNHGRLANEALPELYSRAYCFLECSEYHGFGRTVAEAMACGTPAVITRSGGVDQFARDGVNALMAPVGDVDGLTNRVLQLLDDETLHQSLARQCRESVMDFGRMHSARETMAVLERFMAGGFSETPTE